MRILLTNDDGVHAPGLWYAADALKEFGEVIICVPDREQSGIGTAITLHQPVRLNEVLPYIPGITTYAVEGTPSDAVILALETLLDGEIDLVVSGINQGANLGWDMLISGTVAAALQGYFRGINSMAISVTALVDVPYRPATLLLTTLVPRLMEAALPNPFLLNVNLPKKSVEEIEGIQVTRTARAVYLDQVQESDDARRPYYWISRSRPNPDSPEEGTDVAAIRGNRISITPLQTDLSSYGHMSDYQEVTGHLLETLKGLGARQDQAAQPTWGTDGAPPWTGGRTRKIRPLRSATPRLMCDDLEATIAFYEGLGFQVDQEFKDEEEHRWGGTLRREGVVLRCTQRDQYAPDRVKAFQEHPHGVGMDIYVTVLSIEPLFAGFKEAGVVFSRELETTPSGAREFEIVDPNGYRLVFGQAAPPR